MPELVSALRSLLIFASLVAAILFSIHSLNVAKKQSNAEFGDPAVSLSSAETINLPEESPLIRGANVFGAIEEFTYSSTDTGSEPPTPPVGILVSGVMIDGKRSSAVVKNLEFDTIVILSLGDFAFVPSERIVSIDSMGIDLQSEFGRRRGQIGVPLAPFDREVIAHAHRHGPVKKTPIKVQAKTVTTVANAGPPPLPVRELVIPRKVVEDATEGMTRLLKQDHLYAQPLASNQIGFRVSLLAKNNAISNLGIIPGDVIKSVDGRPFSTAADGVSAWRSMASNNKVKIVINRAGVDRVISYQINR